MQHFFSNSRLSGRNRTWKENNGLKEEKRSREQHFYLGLGSLEQKSGASRHTRIVANRSTPFKRRYWGSGLVHRAGLYEPPGAPQSRVTANNCRFYIIPRAAVLVRAGLAAHEAREREVLSPEIGERVNARATRSAGSGASRDRPGLKLTSLSIFIARRVIQSTVQSIVWKIRPDRHMEYNPRRNKAVFFARRSKK